jgi:carboxypeptidase family protein
MQRLLLLLVAALVIAGGVVFWMNESTDQGTSSVLEAGDDGPVVLERNAGKLAAPDESSEGLAAGQAAEGGRAAANREAAGTGEWIEGTVVVPVGAPVEDLGVWVLDRRRGLDAEEWSEVLLEQPSDLRRVPVENGYFRFRQSADGASRLQLDSKWLYLEEPLLSNGTADLQLAPKLGAALEVTALRPAGATADEQVGGIEVQLVGMPRGRGGMWGGRTNERTVRLDDQGRATFGGLPTDNTWILRSSPERWATFSKLGIDLEPAQTGDEDLAFKLGARISGTVIDDRGQPIEGAEVEWESANRFATMGQRREPAVTDARGDYRLYGVRPGKGSVRATAAGYVEQELSDIEVQDAEVRAGVDLTLSSGLAIAGRVVTSDGAAASGARLTATRATESEGRPRRWGGNDDTTEFEGSADVDGNFRITGLVEGDYQVVAEWKAADETTWRDTQLDIAAGTTNLELTVAEPQGLLVRVIDASGAPVLGARVIVREVENENDFFGQLRGGDLLLEPELEVSKGDEPGSYLVEGIWRGRWNVSAYKDELIQEVDPLEVFADGEDVVVRMVPAASIAGTVVDPDGNVVRGAKVTLRDPATVNSTPWGMSFGGDEETAFTKQDGGFELDGLPAGSYELFATESSWSGSEPRGLELKNGDTLTALVIELRRGGTVHGVIYDAKGQPDSGRSIMAFTQGGAPSGRNSTTSDERGEFTLERLEPGTYQVMAQPDMGKLQEEMEGTDNPSPASFMKMMEMTSATVVEGEVTEIVLGAPPEAPVRIHGRVTKSGQAVDGGMVTVMREGGSVLDNFEPADVKKDGSYELVIDGAGRATVVYTRAGFGRSGSEFPVVIPERADFRLDLELPGGAIRGIVLGKDGGPLKELMVTLERKTGLPTVTGMGMGNMERTDAEGRFVFEDLEAGVYDLRAGGASFFGGGGDFAATVIPDVEVRDGAETPELRVRLGKSGEVAGRVLGPDGEPRAKVALYVRDSSGALLARVSSVSTDANGRFVYKGLPAGEVYVEARGTDAAADPVRVTVREDERTELDLTLSDSTMLIVRAEDADGNPVRMRLSVTDEAGREVSGLRSMTSFQERMTRGLNTTEREVGPLPPGKYRVTGTDDAGREKSRSVTLKGQKERILRLRFSED